MKTLAATLAILALLAIPATASFNRLWVSDATINTYGFGPHCSTASINQARGYWLTAAHCVDPEHLNQVEGHDALILMHSVTYDLAVLHTPGYSKPGLKLSRRAPKVGDFVQMVGHPVGLNSKLLFSGYVANAFTYLDPYPNPDRVGFMAFDMAVCHGNSGSAVTNANQEVVSVMQAMFDQDDCSAVSLGASWQELSRLAGTYFGN